MFGSNSSNFIDDGSWSITDSFSYAGEGCGGATSSSEESNDESKANKGSEKYPFQTDTGPLIESIKKEQGSSGGTGSGSSSSSSSSSSFSSGGTSGGKFGNPGGWNKFNDELLEIVEELDTDVDILDRQDPLP